MEYDFEYRQEALDGIKYNHKLNNRPEFDELLREVVM
jgi:hypothetical protein